MSDIDPTDDIIIAHTVRQRDAADTGERLTFEQLQASVTSPADHAATVREARAKIVKALNLTPLVAPQADTETANIVEDAWAGLSDVCVLADRATELECERDVALKDVRDMSTVAWGSSAAMIVALKHRAEFAERERDEAQRRLRVNSIAWHTKFHEGDWETCDNSSCKNDHAVLGGMGPSFRAALGETAP